MNEADQADWCIYSTSFMSYMRPSKHDDLCWPCLLCATLRHHLSNDAGVSVRRCPFLTALRAFLRAFPVFVVFRPARYSLLLSPDCANVKVNLHNKHIYLSALPGIFICCRFRDSLWNLPAFSSFVALLFGQKKTYLAHNHKTC